MTTTPEAVTRLFVGIDPGLSGALACIDGAGRVIHVEAMPTRPHGKSRRVDGRNVREFFEIVVDFASPATIALVMLEQVASRPGQGAPSVFTFGRAYGAVEGALSALELPVDYITPAVWKRAYGLGSDKAESVRKALDLFPGSPWPNSKPPTHDQAEAVLLAEFARRRWSGQQ